ncbi:hypothetical protein [Arthrobacter globiformis]|uniref:hypothetical protein n=1 Tax=Arthrobacter globiformis TaxID=1665 RepID=UPI0015533A4B|nr:hypothetical protein [Arthrobacter globiformis]
MSALFGGVLLSIRVVFTLDPRIVFLLDGGWADFCLSPEVGCFIGFVVVAAHANGNEEAGCGRQHGNDGNSGLDAVEVGEESSSR